MQQQPQQHHYIEKQRARLTDSSSHKTRIDDFYAKLERIRLTAAASSSSKCRRWPARERPVASIAEMLYRNGD